MVNALAPLNHWRGSCLRGRRQDGFLPASPCPHVHRSPCRTRPRLRGGRRLPRGAPAELHLPPAGRASRPDGDGRGRLLARGSRGRPRRHATFLDLSRPRARCTDRRLPPRQRQHRRRWRVEARAAPRRRTRRDAGRISGLWRSTGQANGGLDRAPGRGGSRPSGARGDRTATSRALGGKPGHGRRDAPPSGEASRASSSRPPSPRSPTGPRRSTGGRRRAGSCSTPSTTSRASRSSARRS